MVGVAVGIFVARHQGKKVYNQSHYSGRNGMVTVGKNQNFERNKKSRMSATGATTDSFDTTTDR